MQSCLNKRNKKRWKGRKDFLIPAVTSINPFSFLFPFFDEKDKRDFTEMFEINRRLRRMVKSQGLGTPDQEF